MTTRTKLPCKGCHLHGPRPSGPSSIHGFRRVHHVRRQVEREWVWCQVEREWEWTFVRCRPLVIRRTSESLGSSWNPIVYLLTSGVAAAVAQLLCFITVSPTTSSSQCDPDFRMFSSLRCPINSSGSYSTSYPAEVRMTRSSLHVAETSHL